MLSNNSTAETNFSFAIEKDRNLSDAWLRRAAIFESRGEHLAAIRDTTAALAGNSPNENDCYLLRGQAYFLNGQYSNAVADLQRVTHVKEIQPTVVESHFKLGMQLQSAAHLEEALAHFEKMANLQPTNLVALYSCGMALQRLGRTSAAIAKFDEALRLDSEFPLALLGKAQTFQSDLTETG